MTGARILLLITCLLQGAQYQTFRVSLLQNVNVLKGSCVTVPCSFQVQREYEQKLSDKCKANWLLLSNNLPQLTSPVTGDLSKKNCTTTFSNVQLKHSNTYYFRLECPVQPKFSFKDQSVNIKVTDAPPSPALTPSTLKVKEGDSVSLKCSAPAPCLPHPPSLTWTPGVGHSQETLQKNQDRTHVMTSVLNFTAAVLHHDQKISCTAVYKKQDGSPDVAVTASLTASVSFPPRILSSSDCTKTEGQVNCSCEAVGNPPPTLYWHLDGQPVNQSKLIVISEFVNVTNLRSIVTVNQAEERDLSSLLCFSFNSVGSASKQFYVSFSARNKEYSPMMPVFITTVSALVLLVCVLLFLIRHLKTRSLTNENNTAELNQHILRELKEESNTAEESLYCNLEELTEKHKTKPAAELNCSNSDRTEGARSHSRNECEEDVVYTIVDVTKTGKRKKKREKDLNMTQSGYSYLEEDRFTGASDRRFVNNVLELESLYTECKPKNVKKETECEYAQVKFTNRSVKLEKINLHLKKQNILSSKQKGSREVY